MTKGRNVFEVSMGNCRVLELIPKMMMDDKFRKKLRRLAMEFEFGSEEKNEYKNNITDKKAK